MGVTQRKLPGDLEENCTKFRHCITDLNLNEMG